MPSTHNYLVQKPFRFGLKTRNVDSAKRTAIGLRLVSSTDSYPQTAHLKPAFPSTLILLSYKTPLPEPILKSMNLKAALPVFNPPTSSSRWGRFAAGLRGGGRRNARGAAARARPCRCVTHRGFQPRSPSPTASHSRLGMGSTAGKPLPSLSPEDPGRCGLRHNREAALVARGLRVCASGAPAAFTNGGSGAPAAPFLPGSPTPAPLTKEAGGTAARGDPPRSAPLRSRGRCCPRRSASSLRVCPPFPGGSGSSGGAPPGGRGVAQAALPGCAALTHSGPARRLRSAPAPLRAHASRASGSSSRRGRRRPRLRRHHG